MKNTEHPEVEQLVAYSESPGSVEHQSTGLHLATCGHCRTELETLSRLRRHAGWITTESSDEELDDVAGLLDNRISGQAAEALRIRIKQDPARLREALHYARHHAAMRPGVRVATVPLSNTSGVEGSWRDTVKTVVVRFLQIETPVWKLVPLAAVLIAAVALFGNFQQQTQSLRVAELIRFDDQSTIQFVAQEPQPGIGFFANTKQTSVAFEGVSVQMHSEREIAFSWPAIDNAKTYHLKLQVFRNGENVTLGRYEGKKPGATIQLAEPPGQHRYEWVLTGDTIGSQSFQTSGGFVVVR